MKKISFLSTLLICSMTVFVTANANMQFNVMDSNGDGFVSDTEFTNAKNKNMQEKLNQGKRLKNAGNSPTFQDIDTNNDGKISNTELLTKQNAQMKERMAEKKANKSNKGKGNMKNKGQQGQRMGQGKGRQ